MIEPKKIVKSRRKTIALVIDSDGELIVRAPFYASNHDIVRFVQEKQDWIEQKSEEMEEQYVEGASFDELYALYTFDCNLRALLLKYILIVLLGLIVHVTIVYGGLFKLLTKQSIKPFLNKFTRVAAVTFSTASSNASVPVSLEIMEELGVGKTTRSFTIPMGATINMDGTAIMQGVAALFIAQIYGIELGINDMITIILTATLASIGTAGVPGVGMIMLSMVLTSVGLPLEGIGLIMGVERIIDMFRTTVNVMGDNIATLVIANSENDINLDLYNSKPIKKVA